MTIFFFFKKNKIIRKSFREIKTMEYDKKKKNPTYFYKESDSEYACKISSKWRNICLSCILSKLKKCSFVEKTSIMDLLQKEKKKNIDKLYISFMGDACSIDRFEWFERHILRIHFEWLINLKRPLDASNTAQRSKHKRLSQQTEELRKNSKFEYLNSFCSQNILIDNF